MSGLNVIERDRRLAEEPLKKPAPKWRNKYYSELPMDFPGLRTVGPGTWWGRDLWPSKDIAATKAAEFILSMRRWMYASGLPDNIEYMGAFAEADDA